LRSGDGGALWQDAKSALARLWQGVLDLVLILWVVRAPFGGVLLGFLIIAKTPQAEDLLIPVADSNPLGIVVFLILHFALWATPTHYSAGFFSTTIDGSASTCDRTNPAFASYWNSGFLACLDSQHFLSWG